MNSSVLYRSVLSASLFTLCFGLLGESLSAQNNGVMSLHSDFSTAQLDPNVARQVQSAFESASVSVNTMNAANTGRSGEFAHSVNEAIGVFNDAAVRLKGGERLEQPDAKKLDEAAMDLETKADWFKRDEPKDPIVTVTVSTKDRKGKSRSGCEVWYVTSFYQDVTQRSAKFDQLSTPTSQLLMPGAYVMWTMMSGKRGEPKPVRVGANRVTTMSVDLPVPH